ncbi:MAG: hypothetical protein ACXVPN_13785 [Bacteroidia bacterium]
MKLLFFNVAFITTEDNSRIENLIATNSIFKIGKKRRRTICSISRTEDCIVGEEQIFAEKTETENGNELLKRLKLPLLSFFTGCVSFIGTQVKSGFSGFFFPPGLLSSRKPLSLSILRI